MPKKSTKKSGKNKKTVKVKVSVEKTKNLTVTNEIESLTDIEQDKQEGGKTNLDLVEGDNSSLDTKVTAVSEEPTKETDKGDNSKMKTATKNDDKDRGSNSKKSKKNKGKSSKTQESSTGKAESSKGSRSTVDNRQDDGQALERSEHQEDEHKIPKRHRSQSGNRHDSISSSKDSNLPDKQKNRRQDRSTSRGQRDSNNSSKNTDFQENQKNRDRSKSGSRQDSSSAAKVPDFQEKQKSRNSGNSQDSGYSQDRHKSAKRERSTSGNHRNYGQTVNQDSYNGKHSKQYSGNDRQDDRSRNSHSSRKSDSSNSESQIQETQENWDDINYEIPQQSSNLDDTELNQSNKRDARSGNSDSYWHPDRQTQENRRTSEQSHKSQDHRKSSNSNNSELNKSHKHKDVDVGKLFDQCDNEFYKHKYKNIESIRVKETFGDLFEAPEDYSLGHCVAEDLGMGSGIAVQFRQKFKQVDELLDQRQKQGGLAVLKDKNRFIYYLVTKQISNGKPTYQTMFKSLFKMQQHIIENNVKKLALPRIGCGLDRLEWDNVKYMLEFLFRDIDIEIIICNYQQDDESTTTPLRIRNCKVVHERFTIDKIDSGTLIIYLSSEDGEVTEEMENLDRKFRFLYQFKTAPKRLGEVIYYNANNYILYGCIVKKRKNDLISFKSLSKCICKIDRENRKLLFNYVGFQAIDEDKDEIINNKIINILRNTLWYVDVYICYPEKLYYLIPPSRDSFNTTF